MLSQAQTGVNGVVAPFTGAWIEIVDKRVVELVAQVAPFTGAWIEIVYGNEIYKVGYVAPFTGAWIEMTGSSGVGCQPSRRSLHGSVD